MTGVASATVLFLALYTTAALARADPDTNADCDDPVAGALNRVVVRGGVVDPSSTPAPDRSVLNRVVVRGGVLDPPRDLNRVSVVLDPSSAASDGPVSVWTRAPQTTAAPASLSGARSDPAAGQDVLDPATLLAEAKRVNQSSSSLYERNGGTPPSGIWPSTPVAPGPALYPRQMANSAANGNVQGRSSPGSAKSITVNEASPESALPSRSGAADLRSSDADLAMFPLARSLSPVNNATSPGTNDNVFGPWSAPTMSGPGSGNVGIGPGPSNSPSALGAGNGLTAPVTGFGNSAAATTGAPSTPPADSFILNPTPGISDSALFKTGPGPRDVIASLATLLATPSPGNGNTLPSTMMGVVPPLVGPGLIAGSGTTPGAGQAVPAPVPAASAAINGEGFPSVPATSVTGPAGSRSPTIPSSTLITGSGLIAKPGPENVIAGGAISSTPFAATSSNIAVSNENSNVAITGPITKIESTRATGGSVTVTGTGTTITSSAGPQASNVPYTPSSNVTFADGSNIVVSGRNNTGSMSLLLATPLSSATSASNVTLTEAGNVIVTGAASNVPITGAVPNAFLASMAANGSSAWPAPVRSGATPISISNAAPVTMLSVSPNSTTTVLIRHDATVSGCTVTIQPGLETMLTAARYEHGLITLQFASGIGHVAQLPPLPVNVTLIVERAAPTSTTSITCSAPRSRIAIRPGNALDMIRTTTVNGVLKIDLLSNEKSEFSSMLGIDADTPTTANIVYVRETDAAIKENVPTLPSPKTAQKALRTRRSSGNVSGAAASNATGTSFGTARSASPIALNNASADSTNEAVPAAVSARSTGSGSRLNTTGASTTPSSSSTAGSGSTNAISGPSSTTAASPGSSSTSRAASAAGSSSASSAPAAGPNATDSAASGGTTSTSAAVSSAISDLVANMTSSTGNGSSTPNNVTVPSGAAPTADVPPSTADSATPRPVNTSSSGSAAPDAANATAAPVGSNVAGAQSGVALRSLRIPSAGNVSDLVPAAETPADAPSRIRAALTSLSSNGSAASDLLARTATAISNRSAADDLGNSSSSFPSDVFLLTPSTETPSEVLSAWKTSLNNVVPASTMTTPGNMTDALKNLTAVPANISDLGNISAVINSLNNSTGEAPVDVVLVAPIPITNVSDLNSVANSSVLLHNATLTAGSSPGDMVVIPLANGTITMSNGSLTADNVSSVFAGNDSSGAVSNNSSPSPTSSPVKSSTAASTGYGKPTPIPPTENKSSTENNVYGKSTVPPASETERKNQTTTTIPGVLGDSPASATNTTANASGYASKQPKGGKRSGKISRPKTATPYVPLK